MKPSLFLMEPALTSISSPANPAQVRVISFVPSYRTVLVGLSARNKMGVGNWFWALGTIRSS